jgi:tryptophanyl-tRNA synthetase
MLKTLFSGVQPTGELHIGNYLGAIKNWIKLCDDHKAIYGIVDYHAVTIDYEPAKFDEAVLETATELLACGLPAPDKCVLFVQSCVPQHTELAWIFNTVTPIGHLQRMTQFKEKSQQHRANVNADLFSYPVLQAADIALYKGEVVPVGEDQVQHLELSREITRKFNMRFNCQLFPDANAKVGMGARILGLDGKSKMSKSLGNTINITEEPGSVEAKLKTAVTDENRKRRSDPGNPDICNLFTIHKNLSSESEIQRIDKECRAAEIGCIECKKALADNLNGALEPIRRRYKELKKDPHGVRKILNKGAEECLNIARQTMIETRKVMGLYQGKNNG